MSSSFLSPIRFPLHQPRTTSKENSEPTDWWQQLDLPNLSDSKVTDGISLEDPIKHSDSFDFSLDTFSDVEDSKPNSMLEALSMAADTFEANAQKVFQSIDPVKLWLLERIWALLPEDLDFADSPEPLMDEAEAVQPPPSKRTKLAGITLPEPEATPGDAFINLPLLQIEPVTPPKNLFTGGQTMSPPKTPKITPELSLLKELQSHLPEEHFNNLAWKFVLNSGLSSFPEVREASPANASSLLETIDPSTFKNVNLALLNALKPHLPNEQFNALCWNALLDIAPKSPPVQTEPISPRTFWNKLLDGDLP